MRTPPCDRHVDGDGGLWARALGSDSWRAWLDGVVATGNERARTLARWPVDIAALRALRAEARWQGAAAVGERLNELTDGFDAVANERAALEPTLRPVFESCERRLWRDLAPYRRRLPPLRVVYVGYPGSVGLAVPPATLVLGVGGWRPDGAAFAAAILAGAAALVEGRSGTPSIAI